MPLSALLLAVPSTSWRMAELEGPLKYARGSTRLSIPEGFRECLAMHDLWDWTDPVLA